MNTTLVRRAVGVGGSFVLGATLLTGPASAAATANATSAAADLYVTQTVSTGFAKDTLYFNGVEVAFVALTQNADGTRLLEVCNIGGSLTDALINVADAYGNATDELISYRDWAGGGCYERTLGYPIRKFELDWFDDSTQTLYDNDNWMLPPTL